MTTQEESGIVKTLQVLKEGEEVLGFIISETEYSIKIEKNGSRVTLPKRGLKIETETYGNKLAGYAIHVHDRYMGNVWFDDEGISFMVSV